MFILKKFKIIKKFQNEITTPKIKLLMFLVHLFWNVHYKS